MNSHDTESVALIDLTEIEEVDTDNYNDYTIDVTNNGNDNVNDAIGNLNYVIDDVSKDDDNNAIDSIYDDVNDGTQASNEPAANDNVTDNDEEENATNYKNGDANAINNDAINNNATNNNDATAAADPAIQSYEMKNRKILDKNTNDKINAEKKAPAKPRRRQTLQHPAKMNKCLCPIVSFTMVICIGVIALDVFIYLNLKDIRKAVDGMMNNRAPNEMDIEMIKTQLEYIESMLETETFPLRSSNLRQRDSSPQNETEDDSLTRPTGSKDLDSIVQSLNAIISDDGLNKQLKTMEAKVDQTVMNEKQILSEERMLVGILSEMKTRQDAIVKKQGKMTS